MLRAESLVRRYGGREVVAVDALELRAGEVLALLGPNGAGKSTLFRLLLLLERPDRGQLRLDGRPVRAGDRAAMRRMAAIFQRPFLFAGTVRYNVAFPLRARGERRDAAARVRQALAAVGLEARADSDVRTLSGGEAQRVALARALVARPAVLALDEPTSNLDVSVRRRFREDLEQALRGSERAVLVITHDPVEAFSIADRVAVMERGRIVQVATPSELLLAPATPFVAECAGAELLLDGRVVGGEERLLEVELGSGARLWAVASAAEAARLAGARVHVAYRPEDVVLAPADSVTGTSAINRLTVTVSAVAPLGALVRVRLGGPLELVALLTRRSAELLQLAPGREVSAQLKATALHAYGPLSREDAWR
ncbi:MAG TPA: ABC transporter ATP-binding protein [Longimicrobiales bacterium]|nr:ABC transporter ATP-binding protein [Longimicrobiales bacterium]